MSKGTEAEAPRVIRALRLKLLKMEPDWLQRKEKELAGVRSGAAAAPASPVRAQQQHPGERFYTHLRAQSKQAGRGGTTRSRRSASAKAQPTSARRASGRVGWQARESADAAGARAAGALSEYCDAHLRSLSASSVLRRGYLPR